jgi:3-oxoacyl-[acyl-carrier-protein] synthase-1
MRRVVVTGLGFISSIGNSIGEVVASLREGRSGIEATDLFHDPSSPIHVAGTVKGFTFPSSDPEDWEYPSAYRLTRLQIRPMAPNCLFGFCAMEQAIADAGLKPDEVSHPKTGALCASAGSQWLTFETLKIMDKEGVGRISPRAVPACMAGSLNANLTACFKIKGASLGFASACSSSAHAFGHAVDLIRLGRQDRIFVVGAEDLTRYIDFPFAAARALSPQKDPRLASRPFDANRDGFVPTGGAAVLVLEALETAEARAGAKIYAEALGWGQASDGYNVMAPEPNGEGLARALEETLRECALRPEEVDYINAHATSTPAGDEAELRAVKKVFPEGARPSISSTKSLTGHGLFLAGALEAGIAALALHEGFMPVSANITQLDPEAEGVPVLVKPSDKRPRVALSNSSGFGGSNVCLSLKSFA